MKFLLFIIFCFFLCACDSKNAIRILEENGYQDIKITGCNILSCGKEDFFRTGFSAISVNGKRIHGTVCEGLIFKDSTIRFK